MLNPEVYISASTRKTKTISGRDLDRVTKALISEPYSNLSAYYTDKIVSNNIGFSDITIDSSLVEISYFDGIVSNNIGFSDASVNYLSKQHHNDYINAPILNFDAIIITDISRQIFVDDVSVNNLSFNELTISDIAESVAYEDNATSKDSYISEIRLTTV